MTDNTRYELLVRLHSRDASAPTRNFILRTRQSRRRNQPSGGARRDRTDDLMLAKHALSQLSYGPEPASRPMQRRKIKMVGLGRLELPTSRLSSARSNQLSYKPKPIPQPVCRLKSVQKPHDLLTLAKPGGSSLEKKEKRRRRASRMIGLTGRYVPSDPIGPTECRSHEGSSLERR